MSAPASAPPAPSEPPEIDQVLLRRFGVVRAVGGIAYTVAALVALALSGPEVWPLLLGIPVLAVVTTLYFMRSWRAPRRYVTMSLLADALVLGGAVATLGGTGTGLVSLYAIVIVSGGILLGTGGAVAFTALAVALSLLQLGLEALGVEPPLLYEPDLPTRLTVLLVSLAGLISVGYLVSSYAGRLHELLVEAGAEAEAVRRRGLRRMSFLRQATLAVREPLASLERVADRLDENGGELAPEERAALASRLRISLTQLEGEVGQLVDAGSLDSADSDRPELLSLPSVVEEAVAALAPRLGPYDVDLDVEPLKVLGSRRAARRVVYSLLENVADHTPPGTEVTIRSRVTGGNGVLIIADDGPGIPERLRPTLFDPDDGLLAGGRDRPRVGLPLVRELCEGMGAQVEYDPPRQSTGSRFLVAFRLAPRGAPLPGERDRDEAPAGGNGGQAPARDT